MVPFFLQQLSASYTKTSQHLLSEDGQSLAPFNVMRCIAVFQQPWPGVAMSLLHHPQPIGSHELQMQNRKKNRGPNHLATCSLCWSFPQLSKPVSIVGYHYINMPAGDDCQWVPVPPTRPLLGRCPSVLRGKRTSLPWARRNGQSVTRRVLPNFPNQFGQKPA